MVIVASALCACAGVRPAIPVNGTTLAADRPGALPYRTALPKVSSNVNVTLEAATDDLARRLNLLVGAELYKGSTKITGLTTVISRSGPIVIGAANDYIHLTFPVAMTLNYGSFKAPSVPLTLKFRMGARITPDWKIAADVHYLGLSDLVTEKIGIGPLSIKPRSIVDGLTQPLQQVLSDLITKKINDTFSLKAQIAKAWQAAQKPVLLNKNFSTWLKITPRSVMLYPLYARDNLVKLSFGLETYSELAVGPEPAHAAATPLPALQQGRSGDHTFRIVFNTDLYYRDLLAIAKPLLLNRELGSDGRSVILHDLDIYGNGDRLVIRVVTSGSLEGTFYLTGKPSFDPASNVFTVTEVDFDMATQSLLLQSADWFLHGTIREIIREKLNVNLTQKLEEARETARKAMTQVRLTDQLTLNGSVKTVKFNDVLVQKEKLAIQVYTEGETTLLFR
jgi:hypothetical protein